MGWYLDNVYERGKEAPYTFYVPSREVIDELEVGDMVKLIFMYEHGVEFEGERMWVEIQERTGDSFKGVLTNEPYEKGILELGQEVTFKVEHICDTEYEDPKAANLDVFFDTKVVVSSDVLDRKTFNFLLRDKPKDEHDSGWTVMSGYEEDEDLADPECFQYVSIGVILNMDDSILAFWEEPALCAYEREEDGKFYKIEDYDWDGYLNG